MQHDPQFSRGTLQCREFTKEFKIKIGYGTVHEICLRKVNMDAHTVINSLLTSDIPKPSASLKQSTGTGQQLPSPM
jgi:hypothetical protein